MGNKPVFFGFFAILILCYSQNLLQKTRAEHGIGGSEELQTLLSKIKSSIYIILWQYFIPNQG
jgi:hypothetical protein